MKTETKLIDINAHITNISCKIGDVNDTSKAIISFDNLGFGVVTAVKFNAKGYNSFGDVVQVGGKDKFYLIIQDISIEKNTSADNLKVKLPNSDIRKVELEECQICYADGSVSSYAGADDRALEVKEYENSGEEKDILAALQDVVSPKAKNIPQDFDFGWLCSCGRFNSKDLCLCSNCESNKTDIFKITDSSFLDEIIEKHHKNEENRQEKAKQKEIAEAKTTKIRNIKIGIGVIVGVVFAILIGFAVVMSGRTTYSSADEMKTALQGTYTYYDKNGTAMRQAVISGDKLKFIWKYSGASDCDSDIDWNPKSGTFSTFEKWIVLSDGSIKNDGEVYKKGGYMSTSTTTSNSFESGASVLKITIDSVTSNSSYSICTGSVKNNGTKTYKYVEVKGSFKDSSGNVIDTDWTYAAGSEGLAPGESTTFRLSVTKNSKINSCSVSLLDYN